MQNFLVTEVSENEIVSIIKALPSCKFPDPDGYNAEFFKATWGIVGPQILDAVKEFFKHGKLLKQKNATIIALVPKYSQPVKVTNYRLISCCNTVYKIISKILTNRLKKCLPH